MATFYTIFTNFGVTTQIHAHVNVACDTDAAPNGTTAQVTVYNAAGAQVGQFDIPFTDGFASSATAAVANNRDLFNLTGNQPGMVKIVAPDAGVSSATLVQFQEGLIGGLQQKGRFVLGIPPALNFSNTTAVGIGKLFSIPLDDVNASALLIAPAESSDTVVDVFHGRAGGTGSGVYTSGGLNAHQQWRVNLQASDEKKHLVVVATDPVVCQLMLDDGRVEAVTCVNVF
jgi:hypothetical protein